MKLFGKSPTTSTSFSEFVRNASSGEKKKVYSQVLEKATKRQQAILKKAESAA